VKYKSTGASKTHIFCLIDAKVYKCLIFFEGTNV